MNVLKIMPKKSILPVLAATLTIPALANNLNTGIANDRDSFTLNKTEATTNNSQQEIDKTTQSDNKEKSLIGGLIFGALGLYGVSSAINVGKASRNKNKFINELSSHTWFKDELIGEARAHEILKNNFHFDYWGNIKENETNVDYTQSDWFKV